MKHKKEIIIQRIKDVLKPQQKSFQEKYKRGIKGYFFNSDREILKKKEEINDKLEEQLQRVGKITMKKILEIDKESSRRISENKQFETCANIVEAEARRLMKDYAQKVKFNGFGGNNADYC